MTEEIGRVQMSAPAKINLSLKILGRRKDGFHEIETLVTPISLYDKIDIERQNRWIDFSCDEPALSTGDENLVVRAAKIFLEETKSKSGVSIKLQKNIPHGAGLGGGSSDAAATLVALNELFETKLSQVRLAELGAKLGSDVPFFIFGSAALCQGRGEIVTPKTVHERLSILLLKPEFGVASEWAYRRWQDSHELPGIDYQPQTFAELTLVNDLERPVFAKFIFLAQLKTWLRKQPEVGAALMSGSGSTVFAILHENADVDLLATRAKSELDPQLWTCACETI
jgi:4-diphosphocytidyl-2-C-methyl-D-erythritol kinase